MRSAEAKIGVPEAILCFDAGVWVKFLVAEEPAEQTVMARRLIREALTTARIIAPAFAWAEVGSVLRKKEQQGLLLREEADTLWTAFGDLPIEFLDSPALRNRAWQLAAQYGLPTLYDAAFLACTETTPAPADVVREFWTADEQLLGSLGGDPPPYVRHLRDG